MKQDIESLLEDLNYYAHQLDVVGAVLVDLAPAARRHQALLVEASEVYQLLTIDLIEIYNALKRAYRSTYEMGAKGPSVPLETLENVFIALRDAAEKASSRAEKLSRLRSREAKMSKTSAEAISSLAENAAKVLVAEAHKAGRWTVAWERELGLRRWLR